MNKKTIKVEQEKDIEVQKNEDTVSSDLDAEIKTILKHKVEQETEIRNARLNVSGNQRLQREIQKDSIERITPVKKTRAKKKKTPPLRNAEGIKLKKDGTVDSRSANFYNGPLYKAILARKKEKEDSLPPEAKKKVIYTPIVESDSEDDLEFEITPIETPVEARVSISTGSGTNDFIKKQEVERERQLNEQLKQIEDEKKQLAEQNKKLKDDFYFNSHLNKISLSARNMKLKF